MTSDLQDYVNQKVASGQFASQEDFVCEAIRLYRQMEGDYASLKHEVQKRATEADQGRISSFDISKVKSQLAVELNLDGSRKD